MLCVQEHLLLYTTRKIQSERQLNPGHSPAGGPAFHVRSRGVTLINSLGGEKKCKCSFFSFSLSFSFSATSFLEILTTGAMMHGDSLRNLV